MDLEHAMTDISDVIRKHINTVVKNRTSNYDQMRQNFEHLKQLPFLLDIIEECEQLKSQNKILYNKLSNLNQTEIMDTTSSENIHLDIVEINSAKTVKSPDKFCIDIWFTSEEKELGVSPSLHIDYDNLQNAFNALDEVKVFVRDNGVMELKNMLTGEIIQTTVCEEPTNINCDLSPCLNIKTKEVVEESDDEEEVEESDDEEEVVEESGVEESDDEEEVEESGDDEEEVEESDDEEEVAKNQMMRKKSDDEEEVAEEVMRKKSDDEEEVKIQMMEDSDDEEEVAKIQMMRKKKLKIQMMRRKKLKKIQMMNQMMNPKKMKT